MAYSSVAQSIILTDRDQERLSAFTRSNNGPFNAVGRILATELECASVVPSSKVPSNIVTMNTRVVVRDEATGKTRILTLVYPGNEDVSVGNLSILTPAGAALIGLSVGETMSWMTRNGQTKELTVVEILYQPEAHGRFDL